MPHQVVDEIISQAIAWGVGAFLTALVAACGVGGFIWKKINRNEMQDAEIKRVEEEMNMLKKLTLVMARHQLVMTCERYLARGCIAPWEFDELSDFHDWYNANDGNKYGDEFFNRVKERVLIRENCDDIGKGSD